MRSDLVLTPGGYRHRSLVHRVEPNHGVHIEHGKTCLMNLATRELVNFPNVSIVPGDIPGFGNAWVAYAYWVNTTGKPITSFRTTWEVPQVPTHAENQIIFLFSGIDPSDPSTGILQPVLQWGISEAGGGPYWSVASWYVAGSSAGSHAYYTPPVRVNVGDTLVGVMALTSSTDGSFNYNCEFDGIAGTNLPTLNHPELVWCNQTLEVYNVGDCSNYPASSLTAMRNIRIQTGAVAPSINWVVQNQPTDCGQHAVVVSNSSTDGEIDIYYRAPQVVALPIEGSISQLGTMMGLTKNGDGIAVLPSGETIHVSKGDQTGLLFEAIAAEIGEIGRGFAMQKLAGQSISPKFRNEVEIASLRHMLRALENATTHVRQALPDKQRQGASGRNRC